VNDIITAKEALLVEAIGDFVTLMQRIETLQLAMDESHQALASANDGLRDQLAAFEGRMNAVTETARTKAVRHLVAHVDNATRRSIELQSRAMSEAARVAFGAEFSATMQRLQSALQWLLEQRARRWERWLTHALAAGAGSAVSLGLTALFLARQI
jgi:hypothetical protein